MEPQLLLDRRLLQTTVCYTSSLKQLVYLQPRNLSCARAALCNLRKRNRESGWGFFSLSFLLQRKPNCRKNRLSVCQSLSIFSPHARKLLMFQLLTLSIKYGALQYLVHYHCGALTLRRRMKEFRPFRRSWEATGLRLSCLWLPSLGRWNSLDSLPSSTLETHSLTPSHNRAAGGR